jgi:hypothetical protein
VKRYAVETGKALCFSIMNCPFCGVQTTQNDTMPWCVACRVEYQPASDCPRTGKNRFRFDDRLKTPRYAFAKALNAAGGMKIGGDS